MFSWNLAVLILIGSLGLMPQAEAQCPLPDQGQNREEFTPTVEEEYKQPTVLDIYSPYSVLRVQQNDFLSRDILRIVMATLEQQPPDPNFINIDDVFMYQTLFQASGYRREVCAQRLSEDEIEEYDRRAREREMEIQDRRFSQKILEGFIQGTVEPSVGGIVGGDPSVIIGFNYNPAQGTFAEIVHGSVNLGGGGVLLSEAEMRRQFVSLMNQHIPTAQRQRLGSLRRVVTTEEAGQRVATEIEFDNIVLTKDHDSQVFRGTLEDGTAIRIYCGVNRREFGRR